MAQLGLGVVGFVVGNIIAPGVGGQIGFAIGAYAGGVLERSMAKPIEGPRLSDLGVSASTYGLVIPEIRGTVRMPGNMIWSTGLREKKKKTGDAMKGPTQNVYTYDASFAFAFCAGGAGYEVLRIWADNKLAFDRTGSGEAIGAPGLRFRVHPGDEFQMPDPAIEADKGDDAPAHRGLFYIVFDSVPLAAFGNRIPSITAEIATAPAVAVPTVTVTNLPVVDGNPFTTPAYPSDANVAVDWDRRLALRPFQEGSTYGIGVSDVSTGVELRVKTIEEMHAGTSFAVQDSRASFVGISPGSHGYVALGGVIRTPLTRFDPLTLTVTGQHPFEAGYIDAYAQLAGCESMATTRIMREGSAKQILLYASIYGQVRIIDADAMVSLWGMTEARSGYPAIADAPDFPFLGKQTYHSVSLIGGEQRFGETDIWLLTSGSAVASGTADELKPRLQRIALGAVAGFQEDFGQSIGVLQNAAILLDAGTIHPGASVVSVSGAQYDPSDNCIVFVSRLVTGTGDALRLVKVDVDGTLVWTTALSANPNIPPGNARLAGAVYASVTSSPGQLVDLRDGTAETFTNTATFGNIFDDISRSVALLSGTSTLSRRFLDRNTGAAVDVDDLVTWLCGRAGLDAADIDVTALSGSIRGFAAGQEAARESLGQIAAAMAFDAVETDDVIRFVPRGGAIADTIAYADLIRQGPDQPALAPTRTPELELPRRLTVQYRDAEKDQQSGAQPWTRKTAPTPLVASREEATLNLQNLVLTPSEAKTIARVRGTTAWAEREAFDNIVLPPEYLALDAADPVTLTLADGSTLRVRLDRVEVQSDFSLRARAVAEDASLYDLTAVADGGSGHEEQEVPAPYASVLAVGAIPLLGDTDDAGGRALRAYAAAGGYAGQDWLGARLFRSADYAQWDGLATLPVPMTWGRALTTLEAPASAFLTDRANTLRLSMQSGGDDLAAATELEMLNGTNTALLIAADGSAEMIRFADVALNGDGSYTIGTLLRGMRGTEWACGLHAPGDLFVLVDDAIESFTLALGDLGETRHFRAVGRFDSFDAAATESRAIAGAAEKPFAPVSIAGSRDGSGNLTVTWVRRTRIGGEWLDGTEDVPLGEDAEEYEMDIMSGGTVVRTVSGLSSPSAGYSAANQTTDFGSAQAAIAVRVYQISATVGRGYAGSATV